MNVYFAPLEGVTTYIYRNTHAVLFGSCDGYYAPFITPSDNERISRKGLKDVLPENNSGHSLSVQVLTNRASSFLQFAEKIKALGYREININLGCPFEGVVRKGRGAGFLADTEGLERFLNEIFAKSDMQISVKTRTGYTAGEEMERLMQIYNRYPLSRLIIHPRTRMDFYKGAPDLDVFSKAYTASKSKVVYNGNVFSAADYRRVIARFSRLEGVMIGRGAVQNPAIFREIHGGEPLRTEELLLFSERLTENYYRVLRSEAFTLQKLKEVWTYMLQNFPAETKIAKAVKKAGTLSALTKAVEGLPEIMLTDNI